MTKNTFSSQHAILYVSTPTSWRGGEQQLAYLMEEMTKRTWPFGLVAPENSPIYNFAKERGYRVFSFKNRGVLNISLGIILKRICKQYKFQLIHANDSHAHGAAVVASLLGCRAEIVLHRRVDFKVKPNLFSQIKYNWKAIRAIICISDEVKRVLLPSIKIKEKIRVVYSGIDINRFINVKQGLNLREYYNIPKDAMVVGTVAALAPHKDYPTFVKAASEALKENPNLFFIAFGEGALKIQIQGLINQSGYSDKIILAGFSGNIPQILPQFDIFLLTSETEGLGTAVLDAFAAGVPVVATRAGGIPEMIKHGINGLLCDIKDYKCLAISLLKLAENPSMKVTFIDNAKKVVKKFSKESMADQIMKIYQNLLLSSPKA